MHLRIVFAGLLLALAGEAWGAAAVTPAPGEATRRELLGELRRLLPRSEAWEAWLQASQELPPDFTRVPRMPYLPDPLRFSSGREVTKAEWPKRRQELMALFQHYVIGSFPASPGKVRAADVRSRAEAGAFIDEVTLGFGPAPGARLRLELIIPRGPGPFPVLLTTAADRDWALVAVSRGYVGCVYGGAGVDETGGWTNVWREADWTALTRRAWGASRCLDYLLQLPVVRTNEVALAGHGENGRTALIAAAMDPRITAVIASSSGAGGACPWRFVSEAEFGEGIEGVTRKHPDWFHPRLRFFSGREHQLPVDQAQMVACIAPRACLISSGVNDPGESVWAIEQSYYSARRVYELLGQPGRLYLRYRPGGHEILPEDLERHMDWLDAVFGRAPYTFPDVAIFPTHEQWQGLNSEGIDPRAFPTNDLQGLLTATNQVRIRSAGEWREKRGEVRERVLWGLGQAPPFAEAVPGVAREAGAAAGLPGGTFVPAGLTRQRLTFGNGVPGDLYYATNGVLAGLAGQRLPAVIWLHPFSVASGYAPAGGGEAPPIALARLGLAVLAFDQIGNGARLEEVRNFYYRYPGWSLLGKMVEDTLAAVERLRGMPMVDPERIYLLGYGTGGMTAMHAGALDERVAGVVTVGGFTPMRVDGLEKGTGGVARWSRWLPLQPRLAAFVGEESRIPYDYPELLALMAPRKVLVFAPRIDGRATVEDVKSGVAEAARVFELLHAPGALRLEVLEDYHRFSAATRETVFARLAALAGR